LTRFEFYSISYKFEEFSPSPFYSFKKNYLMKTLSLLLGIIAFSTALFSQSKQEISGNRAFSSPVHIQGMVTNTDGQSVGNVTLIVLPDSIAFLSELSGSFDVTLELQDNVPHELYVEKDGDLLGGISTFELLLIFNRIMEHILGNLPFTSPYQIVAADLNGDGAVTIFDLLLLRKHLLFLDLTDTVKFWHFVKAGCDPIADPGNCPLDYVETFTTDSTLTGLQITGISSRDLIN